jgi:hypothetical protein
MPVMPAGIALIISALFKVYNLLVNAADFLPYNFAAGVAKT